MSYSCSLFCSFYKGGKFIKGYLENVLEQTIFDKVEFVFVDCNSPDDEKSHIIPMSEKYSNIKYYKLDSDPGLYEGWNTGIRLCTSDIIGVWCIDDRKSKDGLEFMLKAFEKTNADIIYGITYVSRIENEKYVDNDFNEMFPCLTHSFLNLLKVNSPHCMPMWKKQIHAKIGFFDNKYQSAADADFWLRCALNGFKFFKLNIPIGLYYLNPTGRSSDPARHEHNEMEVNEVKNKFLSLFVHHGILQLHEVNLTTMEAKIKFIDQ